MWENIPMATYGMQWAAPNVAVARKLHTEAMQCIWGSSSKVRCFEAVLAVLQDPTKVDHTFASAHRAILDVRRTLLKSQHRHEHFLDDLHVYANNGAVSVVVGQVHGQIMHLSTIDAQITIADGDLFD